MDKVGISVIMPSLNVANYIEECLQSVINQSYRNIEIIIIDAGSTDGTIDILKRYSLKDKRIKVINSDKKSYGYQMNLGIAYSTGDYIAILETDDVLYENSYENLIKIAYKYEPDFVKGSAELFWGDYENAVWTHKAVSVYDGIDKDKMLSDQIIVWPKHMPELLNKDLFLWTGLYKRSFLEQIKFNESDGAAFQDQGFLLQVLSSAKKGIYIDSLTYKYRQNNPSSSIVSKNGFKYLLNEYNSNEIYLVQLHDDWKIHFYKRLWVQTIERFRCMARSGEFWESEIEYIDAIGKKIELHLNKDNSDLIGWSEYEKKMYSLFVESPMNLYSKFLHDYCEFAQILHMMDSYVDDNDIIVFGCGKVGKFIHLICELRYPEKKIVFCDNMKSKVGNMIQGIEVFSPLEVRKTHKNAKFILAGKGFETEMRNQLYDLSVDDKDIWTYTGGIDWELLKIR